MLIAHDEVGVLSHKIDIADLSLARRRATGLVGVPKVAWRFDDDIGRAVNRRVAGSQVDLAVSCIT